MKSKRLDSSHLTPQEKRHSLALVMLGMLLVLTAVPLDYFAKVTPTAYDLLPAIGIGIICFVWGYIGAMEDERSHGE